MSIGWIVVSVWFGGWLVASCFVAARSESEDDAFAGITMLMVWPGLLLMCTVLAPAYLSWRICFRMIPWCNGAADDLDEEWGGICDQCVSLLEKRGDLTIDPERTP